MVETVVLGISLDKEDSTPFVLLHPMGTETILRFSLEAQEIFALSSVLHSSSPLAQLKDEDQETKLGEAEALPSIHNLFLDTLKELKSKLISVELRPDYGGSILGRLVLASPGGRVELKAMVGDSLALALNSGTRIFMDKSLLVKAQPIDEVLDPLPDHIKTIARASLPSKEEREKARTRQEAKDQPRPVIRISLVRSDGTSEDSLPEAKLITIDKKESAPSVADSKLLEDKDDEEKEKKLKELLKNLTPETKVLM